VNAETLIAALYIFALAAFLGYQLISRVPPLLHTPLMAATNAIAGISLVGAILAAGDGPTSVSKVLGLIAVISASINVFGGFMITERMLSMFKAKTDLAKTDKREEKPN
jgi:H+-translocating NAD(P) transhydrogenase subunit alpha